MTFAVRTWLLLLTLAPCAAEDPKPPADKGAAATDTIPTADRETLNKIVETRVRIDFEDMALRNVIDCFAKVVNISIRTEGGVDLNRRVTISLKNTVTGDALKHILASVGGGYDYYVKDGTIHIAPIETVKSQSYWNIYDIANILTAVTKARGEVVENEIVVRAFRERIAEEFWKDTQMAIDGHRLVVYQTGKIHGEIRQDLERFTIGIGSGEDVAMTNRLNTLMMNVDFSGADLAAILEDVRNQTGINIVFRSDVNKHLTATICRKGVPVATILEQVLTPLGYGYYVKDGILHIATKETIEKRGDPAASWKAFLQSVGKPRVIK